jgi:hypothetical protein
VLGHQNLSVLGLQLSDLCSHYPAKFPNKMVTTGLTDSEFKTTTTRKQLLWKQQRNY